MDKIKYRLNEPRLAPRRTRLEIPGWAGKREPRADGSRRTTRYDIDLFKCIYCGFCEESCPVDSIVETNIHEYHFEKRGENIVNKLQLLAIGDRFEQQIAAARSQDAPYR